MDLLIFYLHMDHLQSRKINKTRSNIDFYFIHTKFNVCKCSTGVKPGLGTDSILH